MTKFYITIYSKNENSLRNFEKFLQNSLITQKLHLPFYYNKKKRNKKIVTVLKSPHVNKSAQEQFEYSIYSITIGMYSYKIRKCLLLIKRIRNRLFTDIFIKATGTYLLKNKQITTRKKRLDPNNFALKLFKFNSTNQKLNFKNLKEYEKSHKKINKNLLKKTTSYLRILNYYGGLSLSHSKPINKILNV